jgi:peptide/nickel transport system ATP-binding protein
MTDALLDVRDLRKYFPIKGGLLNRVTAQVRAVDGVSFHVNHGETLGVVGESGCGKSTTARLVMHLIDHDEGNIAFDGKTVGASSMPLKELRRNMQMVFQDSFASLNPRLTIEESIAFGPQVHGLSAAAARERARDLLARVGLNPAQFIRRYPHELSGGQRQRVNIARALALQPRLLILDESVSALDKSVQAQVLNLLADLKAEFGLTYLFISHDLNVVQYIADRVMVMYLGQVAEIGPVATRAHCCRPCPRWTPTTAPRRPRSPATRRTRSTRRRVAASAPAASTRKRYANTRCRHSPWYRQDTPPPAIWPTRPPATARSAGSTCAPPDPCKPPPPQIHRWSACAT